MKRAAPIVLGLCLSLAVLSAGDGSQAEKASQTSAAQCEALEAKVVDLTRRLEALEKQQAPKLAAAPASPQPDTRSSQAAPSPAGREEALALYKRIDGLVVAGNLEQATRELSAWDAEHAGKPEAGYTRALNREVAVVGKAAPSDWSIEKWYQGESDVKLDGQQTTLVVFWEAWCPHCKAEVPKVQALWEKYRGRGLQVVGVTRITQSATEDSVKAFLTESGVQYPMAKETGELATYFDVKGIPAAAMVKDGKIVWRGHPTRLDDALLDAWF